MACNCVFAVSTVDCSDDLITWQPRGPLVGPPGGNSAFVGNPDIFISPDFAAALDTLNSLAIQNGVMLVLTSQSRSIVPTVGTTYKGAKDSNHLTGDAVDVNFRVGSTTYNADDMELLYNDPTTFDSEAPALTQFVLALKAASAPDFDWGASYGDFVHFDNRFNILHKGAYAAKRVKFQAALKAACQGGCSNLKITAATRNSFASQSLCSAYCSSKSRSSCKMGKYILQLLRQKKNEWNVGILPMSIIANCHSVH